MRADWKVARHRESDSAFLRCWIFVSLFFFIFLFRVPPGSKCILSQSCYTESKGKLVSRGSNKSTMRRQNQDFCALRSNRWQRCSCGDCCRRPSRRSTRALPCRCRRPSRQSCWQASNRRAHQTSARRSATLQPSSPAILLVRVCHCISSCPAVEMLGVGE